MVKADAALDIAATGGWRSVRCKASALLDALHVVKPLFIYAVAVPVCISTVLNHQPLLRYLRCVPFEKAKHTRCISLRDREDTGDAAYCFMLPLLELVLVQHTKFAL